MLDKVFEDIVVRSVDLNTVSERIVKEDGVCLIDNRIYIIYLGKITTTNSRLINHLDKLYMRYMKSAVEDKRNFPLFIENNKIIKISYLKDYDWFVVQADGYPLGSKTLNFINSGYGSFEDAIQSVSKFLSQSISEDMLISKLLDGGSVRDLFLK